MFRTENTFARIFKLRFSVVKIFGYEKFIRNYKQYFLDEPVDPIEATESLEPLAPLPPPAAVVAPPPIQPKPPVATSVAPVLTPSGRPKKSKSVK